MAAGREVVEGFGGERWVRQRQRGGFHGNHQVLVDGADGRGREPGPRGPELCEPAFKRGLGVGKEFPLACG